MSGCYGGVRVVWRHVLERLGLGLCGGICTACQQGLKMGLGGLGLDMVGLPPALPGSLLSLQPLHVSMRYGQALHVSRGC